MKSKFLSILVAMAMVVAGVAFSSCGDNNDDPVQPTVNKTATLQPEVYFGEDMLNFYDITVTIDGKAVVLTKDNTQSANPLLSLIKYRKYQADATEYKKFPATSKVVVRSVKKSNVELSSMDDSDYSIYLTANYGNSDTELSEMIQHSTLREVGGMPYSALSEEELASILDRTITGTYTLSATDCSVEFTDTYKY